MIFDTGLFKFALNFLIRDSPEADPKINKWERQKA